jgi:NADPH:quinone reductase-like Zn-dependent oxidoreductase
MPKTMRAIVMDRTGGPEVLHLAEVDVPIRLSAEFTVRVHAAGINPIDAKTRAGKGASAGIRAFPTVPGNDFSGVVEESPYEAHPLQPGAEVYGMVAFPRFDSGTYAEYTTVQELSIAPKPANLSHAEAAGVPLAALTAWGAVVDVGRVADGQRVLIHAGAGGVGHFAVQFAAHFGAHVVTTASERNADWLRSLGAAEVIDYHAQRFEEVIDPVDTVIDLIGNVQDDTGSRSLRAMKPGALIVNVPTGSWTGFMDEARGAGMRATTYKVAADARRLERITGLIERRAVRVHIDRTFELSEAAEAHRTLEEGHTRGKIVLTL